MRTVAATLSALMLVLAACWGPRNDVVPTPTPAPPPPTATPVPPTPTPIPVPTVAVDPLAAVVARQKELQSFRQAVTVEVEGLDAATNPRVLSVWAEGESARPNSRLQVGTDIFGSTLGFTVIQLDRKLYLNPMGVWMAVDAQAIPAGIPLVPIPVAADPQQVLPLLAGGQVVPAIGVPIRGASTDILRFSLPGERAEQLAGHLLITPMVSLLEGVPTYTEASGELAVGREDGFVRRVALVLRGYSGGDPARAFAVQSQTELWDVNDATIAVGPPTEPVFQLPGLDGIRLPGR